MMADWLWLMAPLAAGLLIAVALIPLGWQVLARGMVFADLAIAQWSALGALAGARLGLQPTVVGLPVFSVVFAVLAVLLVGLILKLSAQHREALIGCLYVLGASLATLLVSGDAHGASQLADALNGDLLWVTESRLAPLALVALAVTGWWRWAPGVWRGRLFLALFAVTVALCVDLAGVYIVFATLIIPPLMFCYLRRHGIVAAILAGGLGHGTGLALSAGLDLTAGPAVVVTLALIGLLSLVLPDPGSPGRRGRA